MSTISMRPAGGVEPGWRRWLCPTWIVVISLLIVGPLLMPGFVLNVDMVFTPQQTLLPWMLGVDSGLPRAVPQDAVVSIIAGPISGMFLQKVILLAIPLLAGFGVRKLLKSQSLGIQLAAVTLVIWNPFVAQRLLMGHWALLLTYAATPWLLVALLRVRKGESCAIPSVLLWGALASLVPTGSVLVLLLAVPILLASRCVSWVLRLVGVFGLGIYALTWLIPALVNPNAGVSDPTANSLFDLHSATWGGPVLTALSGSGVWNANATLASGGLPWMPIIGLVLAVLALFGVPRLSQAIEPLIVRWLLILAVAGYLLAVITTLVSGTSWWAELTGAIPGGGLLRDSQKLLLPLALFVALAAPFGVVSLLERFHWAKLRPVVLVILILLPFVAMPDFAFGAFGKLAPVSYPDAWQAVRTKIAQGPSGDAISVPWQTFRRYSWNDSRVVLDPTPRYMTTTVLTNDSLVVSANGRDLTVNGDNPRSAEISKVLESKRPLRATLPATGVRWVIEQTDQPQQLAPSKFQGLTLVINAQGIRLWQVPGEIADRAAPVPAGVRVANLAALAVLVGSVCWAIQQALRRRRG